MLNRREFFMNLKEALDFHDAELTVDEMGTFLDLNYDEDSSLAHWTFTDFNGFATDVSYEGIRNACHMNDLKWNEEDEDDEEEN